MATTATMATAAIIARNLGFWVGLMGRRWRYGKNLFAMFNSGYIDVARRSLRQNSYECYLCPAVVGKSSSLGVLPCLSKTPPFNSRPDEGGSRARGAGGSAGRGSGRLGRRAPSSAGV